MKKYFWLFSAVVFILSSCVKGYDLDKQNAKDDAAIKAYLSANNINATKDATGVYYQIITPGDSNTHPSVSSTVTVGYIGTKLDGSVFDQSTSATLSLTNVIAGWQIGVPKIGAGGEIKIFIPSSLAYGNQDGQGLKNTPLYFDIKLISVN
jgi:FKBP-type peptidyl-prolyl cis-trans isomerase